MALTTLWMFVCSLQILILSNRRQSGDVVRCLLGALSLVESYIVASC